jgi:spore germination protein YaaH
MVRAIMPAGKTLSIAAPASYWSVESASETSRSEELMSLGRRYLKGFPIAQMAPLLDYIVYMTYDLHGQWDYGNPFSIEGCEAGNCLRSQ